MNETTPPARPAIEVGVVMRREPVTGPMSRWQNWRWVLADVVTEREMPELSRLEPAQRPLKLEAIDSPAAQAGASHWLYPGFPVELFRDDAEGYYLNLSSPEPCFWVMWRLDDALCIDGEPAPVPQIVTLSYHDAGRWLDAQERVDQVPAPAWVVQWLAGFVEQHYRPEPKRRQRPQSFQPLADRFGNPASISTGDRRRRGTGAGDGG